jgi:23S rRNA U2552 (ribose-2'-O)-methylase RlmE/FtsJ
MYRCQSAYKLAEIDAHFRIFSRLHPRTVVDLAAAPGGFAQVALELMRNDELPAQLCAASRSPMVIAVDQRRIEPLPGLVTLRGNILQHQPILQSIRRTLHAETSKASSSAAAALPPRTVDMVLHDGVSVVKGQHAFSVTYAQNQMAMSTLLLASKIFLQLGRDSGGGDTATPSARHAGKASQMHPPFSYSSSVHLHKSRSGAGPSAKLVHSTLPVCFISKVLRSPHFAQVVTATAALFRDVFVFKPQASREASRETYVVATHFQPHHWGKALQHHRHQQFSREQGVATTKKRKTGPNATHYSPEGISPALFSMPPAEEDCSDARHMVWNCLGCGRTCMGVQPCVDCGVFTFSLSAKAHS